ncbi:hypothetical protein OAU51_02340, partial [Porticoccaceae bacterium]|nr:hypothetical protein [Porticoccaceae bacterium]
MLIRDIFKRSFGGIFIVFILTFSPFGFTDVAPPQPETWGSEANTLYTAVSAPSLDIDGNDQIDALTDGLLLLRWLFGLNGDALIGGAVANNATYSTAEDIYLRITILDESIDIDGNGQIDALTDGLVILRYLFGLRGDVLTNGVIADNATVSSAGELENRIYDLTIQDSDSDGDGVLDANDAFPLDATESIDTDLDGI